MWYAIICEDIDESLSIRLQHRAAHRARLDELSAKGRLLIAGPHPSGVSQDDDDAGFTGSLIVAEFDSQEAAHEWVNQDPFFLNGVYKQVLVKPFEKVFPL